MTAILLIRHGENDTVGKYLAGRQPDIHLNANGQRQAHQIVDLLKSIPINAIYSSPLERAIETATPLSLERNLPIIEQEGLIELDYGEWQGVSFKDLRKLKKWKELQDRPEETHFPGGETMVGAQIRVYRQIDDIAARHQETHVTACFTHNDVIRLAVAYYLNMPLNDIHRLAVNTASITAVFLSSHKPRLLFFNQTREPEWKPPKVKPQKDRPG